MILPELRGPGYALAAGMLEKPLMRTPLFKTNEYERPDHDCDQVSWTDEVAATPFLGAVSSSVQRYPARRKGRRQQSSEPILATAIKAAEGSGTVAENEIR